MTNKTLFIIASCFGIAVMMGGCSCTKEQHYAHKTQMAQKQHMNKKQHMKTQSPQVTETVVFYQTYETADVDNVSAKMYTRSSRGGESKMGTIKFVESDNGLHMKTDLVDLRPGVTYTTWVYPCGMCNDGSCCANEPLDIDLPTLKIDTAGRLKQSYVIRGLTAAQLNNAKLVLTRDGGYKAAWGTLKQ